MKAAWEDLAQLQPGSIPGCWCANKERAGEGFDDRHCDVIARTWQALHGKGEGRPAGKSRGRKGA